RSCWDVYGRGRKREVGTSAEGPVCGSLSPADDSGSGTFGDDGRGCHPFDQVAEGGGPRVNFDIEMNQVTVRYGDVEALKNISMKLAYGKLYGLLGRNGAGKTTLLSLLGSFLEPTFGTVRIGGMEVFDNEKLMPLVTFIYDSGTRDEHETVKGMLETAERYRPTFDREYANYLVSRFQLQLDQPMKQLSKGQQAAARVTIGLANRSPITILDEAY